MLLLGVNISSPDQNGRDCIIGCAVLWNGLIVGYGLHFDLVWRACTHPLIGRFYCLKEASRLKEPVTTWRLCVSGDAKPV
jgi:hypothetical protein